MANNKKEVVENCLRNEKVFVKYIMKSDGVITNPKHILFGGLADNASIVLTAPLLSSGKYKNILTDDEKQILEEVLGLEYNALSIYKKVDNYWDSASVKVGKEGLYLDLSNADQYIQYKILLANTNIVAPSMQILEDRPKASYRFVIISEKDETKRAKQNMSNIQMCYKEFGKIEDDVDALRFVVTTVTGKKVDKSSGLEWLQTQVNDIIQSNNKMFLQIVTDEYFKTKIMIKQAIDAGIIVTKGDLLYMREDNLPLCEYNEEPTLNIAAKFLNSPKHQDLLFSILAKLK